MSKIRTIVDLQTALDDEFAWRLKEIADLKSAVKQSKALAERTLVRAGIALLYAHWEGFVKSSATAYVNFVNNQGCTYQDLQSCFAVLGVKKKIRELTDAKRASVTVAALDFLRSEMGNRAELPVRTAINAEDNLKSAVFENIALSIGISTNPYESRFNLIDESLLSRRNKIAHGDFLELDPTAWSNLADEVLLLMRYFKTDIENAASGAAYKK